MFFYLNILPWGLDCSQFILAYLDFVPMFSFSKKKEYISMSVLENSIKVATYTRFLYEGRQLYNFQDEVVDFVGIFL